MSEQRLSEVRALAELVVRQRDELMSLRNAMRTHAVIEQAKGLVAERLGCSPDTAFGHLVRLAQASDIQLVQACANVLGVAQPLPVSHSGLASPELLSAVRYGRPDAPPGPVALSSFATNDATGQNMDARYHLVLATVASASDGDELAERFHDEVGHGVTAVLLYLAEPDGGINLEGAANVSTRIRLEWQRLPLHVPTGAMECVKSGQPLWLPDLEAARARYVLVGDPENIWPSRAWLPFHVGSRVAGLVGLMWDAPYTVDVSEQHYLQVAAEACGQRLLALLSAAPPTRTRNWTLWIQHVLDGLPGSIALINAIRDENGTVIDFRMDAASPDATDVAGRSYEEMIGNSVLETYPTIVDTDLWPAYHRVLSTGVREVIGPFDYTDVGPGVPESTQYSVMVSKFGDGLLVAWDPHDAPQHAERLRRIQRLGNLGWGHWNLVTGETTWSEQVFAILGRDPKLEPMRLDDFPSLVVEDDLPILTNAVDLVLEQGKPVDTEVRMIVHSQVRHIRLVAEPTLDTTGRTVLLDGIMQDVTAARRAQEQMVELHRQIERHQHQISREHSIATHLREAVLPLPTDPVDLPGMRVAVRYLAAERWADVGGDWYHAFPLGDGTVLLAIGDVAGHGLSTAATMAQLRYAMTGAAVLEQEPAALLSALNTLLTNGEEVTLASAVIARFEPATRRLTWAQAGHPPPILIHGTRVTALRRPSGTILGAVAGAHYASADLVLKPTDTLLLFTDGLIERRLSGCEVNSDLGSLLGYVRGFIGEVDPATFPGALIDRFVPANPADDTCILAATVMDLTGHDLTW